MPARVRPPRQLERGQTLPVWLFGILTAFTLLFFLVNYANVLRWQIQAQNAADAAAAGAISTQATQWNQMLLVLYSSTVEEWRIRRLIDMMLLTIRSSGGCWSAGGAGTCAADYQTMRTAYLKSVQRYTADVALMQRLSSSTIADYNNDAKQLVTAFASRCGTVAGGDCSFRYTLNDFSIRTTQLHNVSADAIGLSIGVGAASNVKQDLTPAQVEVVTCHVVAPLIPSFFGISFGSFRAIGRAAATTAMVTEEWLQPGTITNPWTSAPFQVTEDYEPSPSGSPWYTVDFSGNGAHAYAQYSAYSTRITQNEFSTTTGWFSSIPEKPYAGPLKTVDCS